MPPALTTGALVKRFGRTTGLAGVDLEVEPCELVGLLARSLGRTEPPTEEARKDPPRG